MPANSDRPWMTALEMQFAALRQVDMFLSRCTTGVERGDPLADVAAHARYRESATRIIDMLRRAEAFAWSRDCANAVLLASKTIPGSLLWPSLTMLAPIGWWWFDGGPLGPQEDAHAIAYCVNPNGVLVLHMFGLLDASASVMGPLGSLLWPADESLGTMVAREAKDPRSFVGVDDQGHLSKQKETIFDIGYIARFFVAGCLWMHQRIVTMSAGPVERHRRKQLAREHDAPLPPDVKVIQLRRSESHPASNVLSEPVEWRCRWVVSGHWRNQYYPSKGEHRLVPILPYVKGPEDKPLRIPSHTVYAVNR